MYRESIYTSDTLLPDNHQVTRNFKYGEFRCPHCGGNHTQIRFILKLQDARDYSNRIGRRIKYHINSGYRCPTHNAAVGGSRKSAHILGLAADIRVKGSYQRMCVVYGLVMVGFTRIGIYRDYIHVDMKDTGAATAMWTT